MNLFITFNLIYFQHFFKLSRLLKIKVIINNNVRENWSRIKKKGQYTNEKLTRLVAKDIKFRVT